jgi:transcriptional regulator of arginine metabolism
MPANKEDQERRREAIRNLLLDQKTQMEDQKDLVAMLKAMGIPASLASVSRDLRELGAVRVKGHYKIPLWEGEEDGESPFRKVITHILSVEAAGPYQTLIVTRPGSGGAVAEAIEVSKWEEIVGTVAGYSSVLVLTQAKILQEFLFGRLRYLRALEFGEEEPEAVEEES